jgi:hypothetical protein
MKKNNILPGATNLILFTLSLIVSLFFTEIILRQIFPLESERPTHRLDYRIPHPVFGWALKPGAEFINQTSEASIRVRYNSKGWRDIEHNIHNPSGKIRILLLGDSFMEAYSVNLEDTFFRQLKKLAEAEDIDIEIINLGVGGYGTLQEYLVFHEVGKLYKPDIVLLAFYLANDIRNNSFDLESLINSDSIKVKSRPFLDSSDEKNWKITPIDYDGAFSRYRKAIEKRSYFLQRLQRKSALVSALLKLYDRVKVFFVNNDPDSVPPHNKNISESNKYLALYGENYCDEPPEYTNAWETTKRILSRLNDEITEMDSSLFVFSVPAMHNVDAEAMEFVKKYAPDSTKLCLEETPSYERLKSILEELHIKYLDLLPAFRNVTWNNKMNLFRDCDRHWNEAGHRLAAKLVLSALIKERLLKHTP